MDEFDNIELRSEEVQEVLGTPPRWIVRYGTVMAVAVFGLLLLVAYIIKYPDSITAQIIITTAIPPESVVARIDGSVSQILVDDQQVVEKDELLAIMQDAADVDDVLSLGELIAELETMNPQQLQAVIPPRGLILGTIQLDYSTFNTDLDDYIFNEQKRYERQTSAQLDREISELQQNIRNEQRKLENSKIELDIAQKTAKAKQELYVRKVIGLEEYQRARGEVARKLTAIQDHQSAISQLNQQIESVRYNKLNVQNDSEERYRNRFIQVKESISRLKSAIDRWKENHLIRAPISGRVSFPEIGRKKDFYNKGEEIMAVVPIDEGGSEIVGKVRLPIPGSGKVAEGQKVIIRFDSYPYQEYGMIAGTVIRKSLLTKDNAYLVEVDLDDLRDGKILTSHKYLLPFDQEMQGQAEIITEDRRFISRILEKFLSLFEDYSTIERLEKVE